MSNELTKPGAFSPGDSRINRKGRIDGGRYGELQKLAQGVLDEKYEVNGKRVPAIKAILRGMVEKALAGDTKATEIVLLAAYGRPPTKCDVEVSGTPEVGLLSSAECNELLAELKARGMEAPELADSNDS